jgi:hypothetical protein
MVASPATKARIALEWLVAPGTSAAAMLRIVVSSRAFVERSAELARLRTLSSDIE